MSDLGQIQASHCTKIYRQTVVAARSVKCSRHASEQHKCSCGAGIGEFG